MTKSLLFLAMLMVYAMMIFAEGKEITMLFGGGYPPFYLEGPDDGTTPVTEGMFPEFLEVFEDEYGYTITKIRLPRKRMDLWMGTGKAQAFSLNSPMFVADSENYIFSDTIWHTKDVVISKQSNKINYSKPEDLFEVVVGKISGNGYGELDAYFENGDIKYYDANTQLNLYRMLQAGRIDCLIGNVHAFPYELKQNGIDVSTLYFSDTPLFEFDLMTQINKENTQFKADLDAFIKQSIETGFLETLTNQYLK